ncbi:tetratricopeptide repeat protein 4 isoform X1 [Oncorhynchus kisutch]|uniref:Probable proline--tRNA ligase, mitochondrial n=2 Tax=Oncorhynchus kisutch TaxID=8019 RepID=A0A8C7M6Z7_ONCKI|nr:tetratricopeptide repeat protein 4 isoform X1 [Oncorhynchus kisutch]
MEVLMHHLQQRILPHLPRAFTTPCKSHSSCAAGHSPNPTPIGSISRPSTHLPLVSRLFQPSNLRDVGQESRAQGEMTCKSQRLMQQAGLIHPSNPGCYYYLPATVRSMEKLVRLIDQEMQRIGGQKLDMPSLCSAELWRRSERWDLMGKELFRLRDRHGAEYCLGPTHEEAVTELLASQGTLSYRQLPLMLYQMTRKFRDEPKPRFGLLRGREFYMKDMYTFDVSEEAAYHTYESVCQAYNRLFSRLGLRIVQVQADTGKIGGKLSHEFQLPADIGEDRLLVCGSCSFSANVETMEPGRTDCPQCQAGTLVESKGIEEFDKVPMFMKTAPDEIDPMKHPELAAIQSIIHDDDRPLEEQAESLKDEGNDYFKEKNYKKAIVSYTAGLKKNCSDSNVNAILLTNRAAAHFHLGNMRSALNDSVAAKKFKPDHLKALIRGASCCMELKKYTDALLWCEEGLKLQPTDKKLLELRATADKHKRAAERDARKEKVKEKKELSEREALLVAIKGRGIKLLKPKQRPKRSSDSDDDNRGPSRDMAGLDLDGLCSVEATGATVFLDDQGVMHWPVLFLYPEHQQTDFISAFSESSSFLDHLTLMFGEELPPWDTNRKYSPQNLQLFFEDHEKESLYQVNPETPLIKILQHKRCFVKAGSPSFVILVNGSPFCEKFLSERKTFRL